MRIETKIEKSFGMKWEVNIAMFFDICWCVGLAEEKFWKSFFLYEKKCFENKTIKLTVN